MAAALAPPLAGLAAGLALGAAVLAGFRINPLQAYWLIAEESFASGYGFGQWLQRTSQLALSGLAVAVAFRAGLFNIGGEGQIVIGSLAGAAIGLYAGQWPAAAVLPLAILGCAAAGAAWGAIPGALKAATGAHEVIVTIMMNFIAAALAKNLLSLPGFGAPTPVHTLPIGPGAAVAPLADSWPVFAGSTLNGCAAIGAAALILYALLMRFSRFGLETRAVGCDWRAALNATVPVGRIQLGAMALGGAFAGLCGADVVLGTKGYFEIDYTAGLGFAGIAVALYGGCRPAGVAAAAGLFAALANGKVALAGVPPFLLDALAAAILLCSVSVAGIMGKREIR